MKIILEFTEEEMKSPTLMREAIINLFGQPILLEDKGTPLEKIGQPNKNKNRIDYVEELEEFANKINPTLTEEAQKKSLKRFVDFYTKRILEEDFKINDFNKVWTKWLAREKNK
jgi:hypothetical protein